MYITEKYETIAFNSVETNCSTKKYGLKIGDYLAVSGRDGHWKIFLVRQGVPFVKLSFTNLKDAVNVAEWCNTFLVDYFSILDIYQDAELIPLVQWTIQDGISINNVFQSLRNKTIIIQDIENAIRKEGLDVPKWAN